jgi:hypothetical protein
MNALGTVSIYGITGQFLFYGFALPGNAATRNVQFNDSWEVRPLLDKNGDPVAFKSSNFRGACVISYVPVGTSVTIAKAASYIPPAFSIVVLSNFNNQLDGKYNYIGNGTVVQAYNGKQIVTLPLLRLQKLPAQLLNRLLVLV